MDKYGRLKFGLQAQLKNKEVKKYLKKKVFASFSIHLK